MLYGIVEQAAIVPLLGHFKWSPKKGRSIHYIIMICFICILIYLEDFTIDYSYGLYVFTLAANISNHDHEQLASTVIKNQEPMNPQQILITTCH